MREKKETENKPDYLKLKLIMVNSLFSRLKNIQEIIIQKDKACFVVRKNDKIKKWLVKLKTNLKTCLGDEKKCQYKLKKVIFNGVR